MHDFRCSDPDDMLDEKMAAKIRYFKETEEGVEYMCKAIEDMRNDVRNETRIETFAIAVVNLMNRANYSLEQAMELLGIPMTEREMVGSRVKL